MSTSKCRTKNVGLTQARPAIACLSLALVSWISLPALSLALIPTLSYAASPKRSVPKPGVVKLFQDAQQLYKAEKFPEARLAFDRILRLYPSHEPSLLLQARTLYKLNALPEAYKAFGKVPLTALDAEASYEYGQTYYQGNQFDGALTAFKRVPDGHALADLANYYGAISAVKLKRFPEAEEMLEKAVVLPDKLAKSRNLYMKHVQEMRLLQERQGLQKERTDERRRLSDQRRVAAGARVAAATAAKKEETKPAADAPYVHQGTQGVTRAGRVDYEHKTQTVDFHSYGNKDSTIDVGSFTFNHGPLFPLPVKVEERQGAVGLQIMFKGEDRKTVGLERRFVSEEDQSDLIRILNKPPEDLHTKQGELDLQPWIELPLPVRHWVALSGDFDFVYPDYETANRTGSRAGTLTLAGKKDVLSYSSFYTFTQFLDSQGQAGSTQNRVNGELAFTWPVGFGLQMQGRHDEFDYVDPLLDGPDASTLARLTASQSFPLGLKLSVAGTYELQENVFFHAVPDRSIVRANGTVYTGKASLTADPLPWISLGISQLLSQTIWNLADPNDKDVFERNVPDYSSELSMTAAIIMSL